MPDTTDVYFRAHTRLASYTVLKRESKPRTSHLPKWTPGLLLLDCVTAKDESQTLRFGVYAVCKLEDGRYTPTETGIFPAKGSTKQEQKIIERFAKDSLYRVLSRSQFTDEVFLPQLKQGVMIAGFGMPFQLFRLAVKINASRSNTRAFSLYFATYERNGIADNPSAFWPGVQVQSLSSGQALYRNLKIKGQEQEEQKFKASQIRILDLQTLALALTGEAYSLEDACAVFGLPYVPHYEPRGRIVKQEIEHAMVRLFRELELLNVLKAEYDKHPIALHPDRALSPAGIVKSYTKAAGLRAPFVSDYGQGIAMQAMVAGRAECCVRRTVVPITYVDFHAQYPAVYPLLKGRELATAERLEMARWTKEARALVETITLENCLQPDFWREMGRLFCLVESDGSILPARCRYSSREDSDPTLGWNHVYTQGQPFWTTGFDVAAAALEGKPVRIVRAFRVMPHGKQATRSVMLRGELSFDPATDDLPEKLVQLRTALKKTAPHLASGLKVGANSAAAGIGSELDVTTVETPDFLQVLSGETTFRTAGQVTEIEKPGSMFCPVISSLVFGGSHLLLAMLHKMIRDAGGEWLFCDTDGAAIISSEHGGPVRCHLDTVQALSYRQVETIRARFESLNPRTGTSFLKLEDENYTEDGKARRQLYGYSVAAKRYALFNLEGGELKLRKVSGHGLAHLQPPYSVREWERKQERKWKEDLHPFIYEAWEYLLHRELKFDSDCPPADIEEINRRIEKHIQDSLRTPAKLPEPGDADYDERKWKQPDLKRKHKRPNWLSLPAALPFPVTTPQAWEKIGKRLLPFSAVTMVMTEPAKYLDEDTGEYEEYALATGQAQWFVPHTENLSSLYGRQLSNLRIQNAQMWLANSGSQPSSCMVEAKTIGGELEKYFLLPESKFNSVRGETCKPSTAGLLRRKDVHIGKHRFIGKESSQRWAGTGVLMTDSALGFDETCREYEKASKRTAGKVSDINPWAAVARKYPVALVAIKAKVYRTSVIRFRNSGRLRVTEAFQKIISTLMELERKHEQREMETTTALNKLRAKLAVRDGALPEPEMVA